MNTTPVEIERKWLLKKFPAAFISQIEDLTIYSLRSAYNEGFRYSSIWDTENETSFFTKTKKIGHGVIRQEEVKKISSKEFHEKWMDSKSKRIDKMRYIFYHRGYKLEIDIFNNLSIIILEIELPISYHKDFLKIASDFRKKEISFPKEIASEILLEVTDFIEFENQNLAS